VDNILIKLIKKHSQKCLNVCGMLYNLSMKRNGKHKGTENKAYIIAMREIRKSNAATTHDNRPNRLRTRKAVITNAIKEYN
jgi:hypothetical protein